MNWLWFFSWTNPLFITLAIMCTTLAAMTIWDYIGFRILLSSADRYAESRVPHPRNDAGAVVPATGDHSVVKELAKPVEPTVSTECGTMAAFSAVERMLEEAFEPPADDGLVP